GNDSLRALANGGFDVGNFTAFADWLFQQLLVDVVRILHLSFLVLVAIGIVQIVSGDIVRVSARSLDLSRLPFIGQSRVDGSWSVVGHNGHGASSRTSLESRHRQVQGPFLDEAESDRKN